MALNRAVALAMVEGPAAGIAAVEEIRNEPALAGYYPLPVTLGELYARAGDEERAAASFRKALEMESPEPVRRRIQERLRGSLTAHHRESEARGRRFDEEGGTSSPVPRAAP